MGREKAGGRGGRGGGRGGRRGAKPAAEDDGVSAHDHYEAEQLEPEEKTNKITNRYDKVDRCGSLHPSPRRRPRALSDAAVLRLPLTAVRGAATSTRCLATSRTRRCRRTRRSAQTTTASSPISSRCALAGALPQRRVRSLIDHSFPLAACPSLLARIGLCVVVRGGLHSHVPAGAERKVHCSSAGGPIGRRPEWFDSDMEQRCWKSTEKRLLGCAGARRQLARVGTRSNSLLGMWGVRCSC